MKVDGSPGVAFETRIEETRRILQRSALEEGHLHNILVYLPCANQSVVRPHRYPSPLPLLDHFGVCLLDQSAEPGEHLPPPITKLFDSRVN